MARIATYSRPSTLDEALERLGSDRAFVIGGGTTLSTRPIDGSLEIVDLQAAGLGGIRRQPGETRVSIGSTVTLDEMRRCNLLPEPLRDAARRELPSTIRTQATVGGLVAVGPPDSELVASLLVYDAVVTLARRGRSEQLTLDDYLSSLPRPKGDIITLVTVATDGRASSVRTARTRADRPIVAAVARRAADGSLRLALSGVATRPILLDGAAPESDLRSLHPPGDFRGSTEYRTTLGRVLSARVLEEVS